MRNEAPIQNQTFFSGGNAKFTVVYKDKSYDYVIRQPKPDMPFFLRHRGKYVGSYRPKTMDIKFSPKSYYHPSSDAVKAVEWAFNHFENGGSVTNLIIHNGKCCRCGRTLTDATSIRNGIGPECARHWQAPKPKTKYHSREEPEPKPEPGPKPEPEPKPIEVPEDIQMALNLFGGS